MIRRPYGTLGRNIAILGVKDNRRANLVMANLLGGKMNRDKYTIEDAESGLVPDSAYDADLATKNKVIRDLLDLDNWEKELANPTFGPGKGVK